MYLNIAGADASAGKRGDRLRHTARVLQHMDDRRQMTLVCHKPTCGNPKRILKGHGNEADFLGLSREPRKEKTNALQVPPPR